jgi:N-acetylglucosaminyldiphosphoundecaprenol N-acetyl-beta-D-mannosaminyltransferase
VEYYSPPFAALHEIDNSEILRRLQAAKPDILLVAFGCPKQEKWIFMHYREMGIPCAIGVGATIDFLAGKFKRAPRWMAALGMEWIFRMAQEPGRLVGRYARDLVFLFLQLGRELLGLGRELPLDASSAPPFPANENLEVLEWKGALTASRRQFFPSPKGDRPFIIDLSAVTSVDHVGLGTLLRAMRPAWAGSIPSCIARPSPAVTRAFAVTGLGRILPIAHSPEEAARIMAEDSSPGLSRTVDQKFVVAMPLRLTVSNAAECHKEIVQGWDRNPRARILALDCSETAFMDSSGLGLFLKAKRLAEGRAGGSLTVENPTENVLNVLRVSKLEKLFFGEEK